MFSSVSFLNVFSSAAQTPCKTTDLQWCMDAVMSLTGNQELATKWWLSPNNAFGMQTPNSMPITDR